MPELVGGLFFVVIAQFALVWYKLGRVEQAVRNHIEECKGEKHGKVGRGH